MRISSMQIHRLAVNAMLNQQSDVSHTQLQLATGRRILTPSEDPVASEQILQLRRTLDRTEQYTTNADQGRLRLQTEESVLASAGDQLQRIRELAIQAANDSNGQEQRAYIAKEMRELLDELVDLSNTTDGNGEYLFAGTMTQTKPFVRDSSGNIVYYGDQMQRFAQIGDSRQVAVSDPGSAVFELIKNGNGTFQVDMGAGNATNLMAYSYVGALGQVTSATITDPATFVAGEYRLQISGGTYNIYDESGGLIQSGATAASITFQGITANLVPGDGEYVIDATRSNLASIEVGSVLDSSAWVAEDYTVTIDSWVDPEDPSLGVNYTVNGVPSGFTVSGTLVYPDQSLTFRGIQTAIQGQPVPGDTFTIAPSTNQSLFETVDNLIYTLEHSGTTAADKTAFQQNVAKSLVDIDQGMTNLLDVRAEIGARLNAIDGQKGLDDAISLQTEAMISELGDLDYAEAISRFSIQMVGLQAAQQSYSKVQNLSLFNYI